MSEQDSIEKIVATLREAARLSTNPLDRAFCEELADRLSALVPQPLPEPHDKQTQRMGADSASGADVSAPRFEVALNLKHPRAHEAAQAFWDYWKANGETHRHGFYESTWGAINRALRLVGVVDHKWEGN